MPRSETICTDTGYGIANLIELKCTMMTIYDRCCHVSQFFEANGTCTSISWISLEIPSYILQRNVEKGLSQDTVCIWYIVHSLQPQAEEEDFPAQVSNEESSLDSLPYKSSSYGNQIREMDFSAGLRRRFSRTVRTLESAH